MEHAGVAADLSHINTNSTVGQMTGLPIERWLIVIRFKALRLGRGVYAVLSWVLMLS